MKKQTKRNNTGSGVIELLFDIVIIAFSIVGIFKIASWVYEDIESGNNLKRYHYISGGDQTTIGCDGKFVHKRDLPKDGLKCSLSEEANQND